MTVATGRSARGNAQHIATSQVVVMMTLAAGENKVEAITPTSATGASVTHLAIVVTIAAGTATGGKAAAPGLEAPNGKTAALGLEAPNG